MPHRPHGIRIARASARDLPAIRAAYEAARVLQQQTGSSLWPCFEDEAILAEVAQQKVFGVFKGEALAGVFTAVTSDPLIWGERECGEHIYLHRIARAAGCTVNGLFDVVFKCARGVCESLGLAGVRMDTWASNATLIAYYERHGFRVVDRRTMAVDSSLPAHYHGTELALLEHALAKPAPGISARPAVP